MSRLILTVSVFVLIAGCNKNPRLTKANFDKIQPGMTIAEVEAILGPGEQEGGDLSIAEGSGKMRGAVVGHEGGFLMFGACAVADGGRPGG